MTHGAHPPGELARRAIDAGRSQAPAGDRVASGPAAACGYLYDELSRWIGSDGCHALFVRALADARKESQALQSIQLTARAVPYVQGLEEAVAAHGDAETAAGIEVLLTRLLELLGRLIGDEMALKLIEPVLAKSETGYAKRATRKEPK